MVCHELFVLLQQSLEMFRLQDTKVRVQDIKDVKDVHVYLVHMCNPNTGHNLIFLTLSQTTNFGLFQT